MIEEIKEAGKQLEDATAELAAFQTMEDMLSALVLSIGGARSCVECEYLNVREWQELTVWEQKNAGIIERWLRWKGCHLFKMVSIGGCEHVTMKWQVEERKKRAV